MASEYVVKRGEAQHNVTVLEDDGSRVRVRIGEREATLTLTRLPDGRLALQGEGLQRLYRTFESRQGLVVVEGSAQRTFEVLDAREQYLHGGAGKRGGSGGRITASMPGRVVRIPVKVGDIVPEGAVVAVLEAMKMENDVRAPGGGRVAEIAVQEGAAVEAGALLVQMEPVT